MNRKLIFLDIDGTLTEPGSNIPPESAREAIRAARKAGHGVFLCTGRNLGMLQPLMAYGFDGAVASSGGYVFIGDRVLCDCPMTEEQKKRILRLLGERGVYRTVETRDASYCDEGIGTFLQKCSGGNSEILRWRRSLERNLGIRPMSEYDGSPVYKVLFLCASEAQLAPAIQELGEDFTFRFQDPPGDNGINGEIINRKFDKGRGIQRIAESLNVALEDTIGMGDSMNDLEMIQTVGIGVCMENGSPQLKKISRLISPAVGKDGLAWTFRELNLMEEDSN